MIIMAEKKLTKREKLEMLLKEETVQSNAMYKELIEKEIETLKNKAENRKPTEKQKENAEIGKKAVAYLNEQSARLTVTQLQTALDVSSNQKMSRIMSDELNKGTVNKVKIKGVTYYEPLNFTESGE
jgi:4-hydroxy-L-threonine phosphate dehydrogenase PdxA